MAVLVFVQAGLGAWVSSSGASLACPDFPTCQGTFFPRMEGLVGIHYTHRLGAYLVFAAVLGLSIRAAMVPLPPRARLPLRLAGILVTLQMILGIGNVVLRNVAGAQTNDYSIDPQSNDMGQVTTAAGATSPALNVTEIKK